MNMRVGWNAALGAFLLAVCPAAFAGGADKVLTQAETSMLLTGKIQVDTEGRVTAHSLDDADKVPTGVVTLINQTVPSWVFQPTLVDGKPMKVATDMSIRVVARRLDGDTYEVAVRNAAFGVRTREPNETARGVDMTPPPYPVLAARDGVSGTVYLLVLVGRDGNVIDSFPEQTNLKRIHGPFAMVRWRRALEDASTKQALKWKFAPPTQGEDAQRESWVMRVPVAFGLGKAASTYGKWETYIPGPRQDNPWSDDHGHEEGNGFSPDMLAPGGAYLAGSGLKLLTQLSDS